MKKFYTRVIAGQFDDSTKVRLEDVTDVQAYEAARVYDEENGTSTVEDLDHVGYAFLNTRQFNSAVTGRITFQQDDL